MLKNFLIGLDQAFNTLVWAKGEGFGKPDETLSARLWRLRDLNWRWSVTRKTVDFVALKVFNDPDHCQTSFDSERLRKQLPKEYQT